MKKIKLTKNKETLVDDEDFERLSKYKWHAHKERYTFYARRRSKHGRFFMHREIMKCPENLEIDHIDGDGLNNQKKNLRICTQSQNFANRNKLRNNTSGYKGVSWYKPGKKWRTQIKVNCHVKHLGYFSTPEDAAQAYNIAAERYHGEFAKLNKIPQKKEGS
jgi:hypothetical protein